MEIIRKMFCYSKPHPKAAQRTLLIVAFSLALSGCDTISTRFVSGLSAEERAFAAQLNVYPDTLPAETFVWLGEVSGISCRISRDDQIRVSKEHALEELRRAAVRAGGNAVMDARCGDLQRGTGSLRCYRSIECHGIAIQQKSDSNNQ